MRLSELKRRTPGWLRRGLRYGMYAASKPLRGRGILPGEILSHAALDDLAAQDTSLIHTTERITHTWSDPTTVRSPIQSVPRPVDTEYSKVRCRGADGWRFDNNHLIAPDGRVVYETNLSTAGLGAAFRRLDPSPRRVEGVAAYLSNTWPTNFFHWMVLTMPLIDRYREFPGGPPDWYYIGETPTQWQLDSLELAGVRQDQLLVGATAATELWNVSQTRLGGGLDPRALRFVRSLTRADEHAPGSRRLFIDRGAATTRRFLNEDANYEAVADLGFERVSTSGLSLREEIELFKNAAVVISCHGSALTNLLFVPRGTRLIELIPYRLDEPSNHIFQEIIAAAGGSYVALEGDNPGGGNKKAIDRDLFVGPSRLRALVEATV